MNQLSKTRCNPALPSTMLLWLIVVLMGCSSALAQDVTALDIDPDNFGYTTISPEEANLYKANYLEYIRGLEDNVDGSNASIELTDDLRDAINHQNRRRNAEPDQVDHAIIYGLQKVDAATFQSVIYQMVYPVGANDAIIPITKDKVFVVRLPVTSGMRLPTSCPPYCD